MQRIALVTDRIDPAAPTAPAIEAGGDRQGMCVAQLGRHLAARGHRVDIFTRLDGAAQPPVSQWLPGVRLIRLKAGPVQRMPNAALLPLAAAFRHALRAFMRSESAAYDLLHAHDLAAGLAARAAARDTGAALVMSFHELADRSDGRHATIEGELAAAAQRVIALSSHQREELLRRHGVDPARIDVVPCGFDPDELTPVERALARSCMRFDDRRLALLHVGRAAPDKGLDTLIRVLPLLRAQHGIDADLELLGAGCGVAKQDGAEIAELSSLASALGVRGRVHFGGSCARDHLRFAYHAADIFVTMPRRQASGIAAIEAMACGLPVVAARTGALRDLIEDGISGVLVDSADAAALAAACARLHHHPGLRHRIGRAAFHHAYSWDHVVAGVQLVYGHAHELRGTKSAPLKAARADAAAELPA